MPTRPAPNEAVPDAILGRLVNGAVNLMSLRDIVRDKFALIVGVPGAFTPVCTKQHVPDTLSNATRLFANGVEAIICVAPDNPWAVEAWAEQVDPAGRLTFYSDRNLSLARALGVTTVDRDHFLGETSKRYLLVAARGVIRRLSVEPTLTELTCTRTDEVVFID